MIKNTLCTIFLVLALSGCGSKLPIDQQKVNKMTKNEAMEVLNKYAVKEKFRSGSLWSVCGFNINGVRPKGSGKRYSPYSEYELSTFMDIVQLRKIGDGNANNCNVTPPTKGPGKKVATLIAESLVSLGVRY